MAQLKTCAYQGKLRYPTEDLAVAVAVKRWRKGAPLLRAYKCPKCADWHLTKLPIGELNGDKEPETSDARDQRVRP